MNTKDKLAKVIISLLTIVAILCINLSACSSPSDQMPPYIQGFSVHYIDVGNGDCIFINFDDGKTMIIDGGASIDNNYKNLTSYLSRYNVTEIDYLLITHPDVDHVGNASLILQDYTVKKAFIPNILDKNSYITFNQTFALLQTENCAIEYSSMYSKIEGENYYLAFLSPLGDSLTGNYYSEFNLLETPNDRQVNDLSPIVYLQYKGVKFVFTGDASTSQERLVLQNYNSGLYSVIHGGKVSLDGVHFLKLAHHGSADSTSQEFANYLCPQNAVVSVGGNNVYGHPATVVFNRLTQANPNVKVLRTDVLGSISVGVNNLGQYKIYS